MVASACRWLTAWVRARTAPSRVRRIALTASRAPRCARLGVCPAGEMLARRAGRVERVGLRAVAPRRALRPVDLDHAFAPLRQVRGQPAAVPAGAFDGPHPDARRVALRQVEHPRVSPRVGRQFERPVRRPERVDHRRGVGVLVRVDADHEVDRLPEFGHGLNLRYVACSGAGLCDAPRGRTETGHVRQDGQASDQAMRRWSGRRLPEPGRQVRLKARFADEAASRTSSHSPFLEGQPDSSVPAPPETP